LRDLAHISRSRTLSDADGQALLADHEPDAALARAIERWRARIPELPSRGTLAGR